MALIPITTATVEHPFDSTATLPVLYAVIDRFKTYDKATRRASFDVDIYTRVCTSEERKDGVVKPIQSSHIEVKDADFDTYLCAAAISADDNQYRQAYLYLLQITDENDNLIWGSVWQGDE